MKSRQQNEQQQYSYFQLPSKETATTIAIATVATGLVVSTAVATYRWFTSTKGGSLFSFMTAASSPESDPEDDEETDEL
mgnify:CR=1 FL=1